MPEIGVQRFAARHHQEHGAQHHESPPRVFPEEAHGVIGRYGGQHARLADDLAQSEHAERREPDEHHGAEHRPDPRRPATLQQEQPDEDHQCHGKHPAGQLRSRNLEPLDGAEHGDRRREGSVRVQERRAENAQDDHDAAGRKPPRQATTVHKRHQGEHTAFALVVGANDHDVILDGDDDHERPEHHRHDAEHVARRDADAVGAVERLADRVQRAGPDVAVHDTQGGERQREEIAAARAGRRFRTWGHGAEY